MKKYSSLLFCIVACASYVLAEDVCTFQDTASTEHTDTLAQLRTEVAEQTIQIKNILTTLCEIVSHTDSIENSAEVCRALNLVNIFIEHFCSAIADMSIDELSRLVHINEILITQLQQQITNGDLSKLDIDVTQFSLLHNKDILNASVETLQEDIATVRSKIAVVWNLLSPLTLIAQQDATSDDSFLGNTWETIKNNQGYVVLGGVLLALDQSIRLAQRYEITTQEMVGKVMYKTFIYSLATLYVLRQKKDKDIADLAKKWFGKDSMLGNTIITLKDWVGSPKAKKPTLHIIARHDMTAQEQIDWGKAQDTECVVAESDRGRNNDFLKNFFEFEDGLFKIPMYILFAAQVKEDITWLARDSYIKGGFLQTLVDAILPKDKAK